MADTHDGRWIFLEYPLDQLMNRACQMQTYEQRYICERIIANHQSQTIDEKRGGSSPESKAKKVLSQIRRFGGLQLPDAEKGVPGTGNIIIRGKPGTAKSTLALWIAHACTNKDNNLSALYISLEEPPEFVKRRAERYGWGDETQVLRHVHSLNEFSSPQDFGRVLEHILTQPPDCPLQSNQNSPCRAEKAHGHNSLPKILLPHLSPRSLAVDPNNATSLFLERYKQLEYLLSAAKWIRDNNKDRKLSEQNPELRLLCIDSLNVFGDNLLSREELYRVFDLCRRYDMIGIFIVEEDESQVVRADTAIHGDILEYLADVVISLKTGDDKGYFMRYIEIIKSRYQHQVYGRHPFKLVPKHSGKTPVGEKHPAGLAQSQIKIFPSLHYIVSATKPGPVTDNELFSLKFSPGKSNPDDKAESKFSRNDSYHQVDIEKHFGINNLHELLAPVGIPFCIIIIGPSGTFKTTIARNTLFQGLLKNENTLLINLSDQVRLTRERMIEKGLRLGSNTYKYFYQNVGQEIKWMKENWEENKEKEISSPKYERRSYSYRKNGCRITEIAFKSGYLLPEEFIETVREELLQNAGEEHKIGRVVFDDVGMIGASYPLLCSNETAGEIFLSTFVHLMKIYQINLVMTGTIGDFSQSDMMVERAISLADTLLKCEFRDIFGDRYVLVSGEGMVVGRGSKSESQETVPGILQTKGERFDIDIDRLKGLVGFDTGHIHRPGLTLNIFTEGESQNAYNHEVAVLLRRALDQPESEYNQIVKVKRFDSKDSEAVHDSINVITGSPLNNTVIYSVDEFDRDTDAFLELEFISDKEKSPISFNPKDYIMDLPNERRSIPYYSNVLLMAFRKNLEIAKKKGCISPCVDCSFENNTLDSHLKWQCIYNKINSLGNNTNELYPFDFDFYASETLSCLMMDALISGYIADHPEYRTNQELLVNSIIKGPYSHSQIDEVTFMIETLKKSPRYKLVLKEGDSNHQAEKKMIPNAAVYICWYSQLRSLLWQYPDLSGELNICSLPGWGFTGDWYLGIMKGSVSNGLGIKVLKSLCNEREEYKRFVKGVGLPTMKVFYEERGKEGHFYTWPGTNIKLDAMRFIYQNAYSRSQLAGYKNYRSVFSTACKLLLAFDGAENEKATLLSDIVNQLSNKIEVFTSRSPEASKSLR
jgi:KaiC/GvpD/RAD55 family RecA-like ATPase